MIAKPLTVAIKLPHSTVKVALDDLPALRQILGVPLPEGQPKPTLPVQPNWNNVS